MIPIRWAKLYDLRDVKETDQAHKEEQSESNYLGDDEENEEELEEVTCTDQLEVTFIIKR